MSAENNAYNTPLVPAMKYNPSVFRCLIESEMNIYKDKRDYYAANEDNVNMVYFGAKADACAELLRILTEKF